MAKPQGAVYSAVAAPRVENCILWENDVNGSSSEMDQINGVMPLINHCCVQGWTGILGGVGNTGSDPLLAQIGGIPGEVHLSSGSAGIDAGDNASVPADREDLDGDGDTLEPIPLDLGGVGRFADDPATMDNGVGPVVDMGAHEYHDCQNNGVSDALEISLGQSQDCNRNGVPDDCDVWNGTSSDADRNGVPDECSTVAVTEIMTHPRRGRESRWEFIEVTHCGSCPVRLFTLTGSMEDPALFGNVDVEVQPGEVLVLTSRSKQAFVAEWGSTLIISQVITIDEAIWPGLNDRAGTVRLLDEQGELLDEVRYDFLGPKSSNASAGFSASLEVRRPNDLVIARRFLKPSEISLGRSAFLRNPFVGAPLNDEATPHLGGGGWRWSDHDPRAVLSASGDLGSPGSAPRCD